MRMRLLTAAIVFLAGSFLAAPGYAQDAGKPPAPSIAIVDVEKILRESLAVQSARTQIDEIASNLQKEIASEEEKLRSEEQQLQQQPCQQQQKPLLSPSLSPPPPSLSRGLSQNQPLKFATRAPAGEQESQQQQPGLSLL